MENISFFDLTSFQNKKFESMNTFLDVIEPYYVFILITLGLIGNSASLFSTLPNKYK